MPGFIDAHRHIVQGDAKEWLSKTGAAQLQEFLDAGFTTVLCAICPDEAIEMRQRIEAGTVKGPRLLLGSIIPVARAGVPGGRRGDPARFDNSRPPLRPTTAAAAIPDADIVKAVESVAARKFDFIKTVITTTPNGPETRTLKLIVDEGKKRNLPTITHAVSVIDTLAAVEAMPAVLVHTPHIGRLEEDAAAVEAHCRRRHPDDLHAAGVRAALRRRQHAALPRRAAVPVGHDLERGAGPGERAAAVGGGHLLRLRHRHHVAAAAVARRRAAGAEPDVLAARHHEDHGAERRALHAAAGSDRHASTRASRPISCSIDGNPLTNVSDLLKVVTTIKGGRIVSDRRAAAGARRP